MEAIALPADLDEVAMVHEPVEEGSDGRRVAEHLGPVLEGPVRRDDRRRAFVAAHDDF